MITMKVRSISAVLTTLMIFGIALAAVFLPSASVAKAGSAAETAARVTMNYTSRGNGADSIWVTSTDETGCISTYTNVGVGDTVAHTQPGAPAEYIGAWVGIYTYDWCQGIWPTNMNGNVMLSDGQFTIDKKLNQATLNATIPVYDEQTGITKYLDVNLTWTGIGDIERINNTVTINEPGFKYTSHLNGQFRQARVSGSISDGTTNYTAGQSLSAQIHAAKIRQIIVDLIK
jgi:hypothetical protein